jgi:hypothetical protein
LTTLTNSVIIVLFGSNTEPVKWKVDEDRHTGMSSTLTPNLQSNLENWNVFMWSDPNRMSFVSWKYIDLCVLNFAHCQRRLQLFIVYCPVCYLTFRRPVIVNKKDAKWLDFQQRQQ